VKPKVVALGDTLQQILILRTVAAHPQNPSPLRAGKTILDQLQQWFGLTLLSFGESASLDFRSSARILFSSLGTITELTETEMDIGSAIAGSGPAFVLELIEEIARIGEKEGIPYKKSLAMTAQTFLGAAAFVVKGASPEDLITQIATAGGMTMEGLKVLKASGIKQILETTIKTASARSKKFSEEF
jgi:pyrroline-5-carboxylate reductase